MSEEYPIGQPNIPLDPIALFIAAALGLFIILGLTGGILYLWSLI